MMKFGTAEVEEGDAGGEGGGGASGMDGSVGLTQSRTRSSKRMPASSEISVAQSRSGELLQKSNLRDSGLLQYTPTLSRALLWAPYIKTFFWVSLRGVTK